MTASASLETLWQDARYCVRVLRKNPGFTAAAVLTLALGIGANTAMFSVLQGILLAPLSYGQPDRLVVVWENNPRFQTVWASYPNFRDWQSIARSCKQMAAWMYQGVDVTAPGTPEHVNGKKISSGFFTTLGVKLTDQHGGNPVAVISNRLWINRFGAKP